MSCCIVQFFRDYSCMSNVSRLNHNHISSMQPFIFLFLIELIIYENLSIMIYLSIFHIIGF